MSGGVGLGLGLVFKLGHALVLCMMLVHGCMVVVVMVMLGLRG